MSETPPDLIGKSELCTRLGIKSTRIDFFCLMKIVEPAQDATRGGARLFSPFNAIEATIGDVYADLGLSGRQLQQLATVNRQKVFKGVRPEAGFDLHARAAFGLFVEQVKGIARMFDRSNDRGFLAWVKHAETAAKNKHFWRRDGLDGRLVTLLAAPRPHVLRVEVLSADAPERVNAKAG